MLENIFDYFKGLVNDLLTFWQKRPFWGSAVIIIVGIFLLAVFAG